MPVSYPQPNCPEAKKRFEFAPVTPSWIGNTKRPKAGVQTLADRLSMALHGQTDVPTSLSTGDVEVDLDAHKFRRPVTGRRPWVTGVFPSRKTGRPIEYESMNEAALIKEMEVDPGVRDFRSQAVRFTFAIDGKQRHYTADFLRLRNDNSIEVIEIKSDPQAVLKDTAYLDKLQRVHAICGALGWTFSVYFGRDLRADNVFNFNIHALGLHVNVPLARSDIGTAMRLAERREARATLGELIDLYGNAQQGAAKALALIGRGVVNTDLTLRLTRSSLVTAAESVQ